MAAAVTTEELAELIDAILTNDGPENHTYKSVRLAITKKLELSRQEATLPQLSGRAPGLAQLPCTEALLPQLPCRVASLAELPCCYARYGLELP